MEQLFMVVNLLLKADARTQARQLRLRCYKVRYKCGHVRGVCGDRCNERPMCMSVLPSQVVPLTPQAGVTEWVENTTSIGNYLASMKTGGAHARYGTVLPGWAGCGTVGGSGTSHAPRSGRMQVPPARHVAKAGSHHDEVCCGPGSEPPGSRTTRACGVRQSESREQGASPRASG